MEDFSQSTKANKGKGGGKTMKRMSSSTPTYGEVVSKTALEILGMFLLVLPLAYIYVFTRCVF